MKAVAEITISGMVQGVGFRWFTLKRAKELDLTGFVKNLHDGNVFVRAEGEHDRIEVLIEQLRNGPTFSRVKNVTINWSESKTQHETFFVEE